MTAEENKIFAAILTVCDLINDDIKHRNEDGEIDGSHMNRIKLVAGNYRGWLEEIENNKETIENAF